MFLQLMALREISGDEAVQWSAWYWGERFRSTAITRKAGYRVNYDILDIFNEVLTMATKRSKNAEQNKAQYFQSVEWLNVNLTVEDAAEIDVWLSSEPDVLGELCRLVIEGYGIAIKPANRGDGFMATATTTADASGSNGRGLSAFADTPYEAAACLLYKIIVKLDGSLATAPSVNKSRFR